MGNAGIAIFLVSFAASHCVPVFRSGGRTNLTFWQWVYNHTIFGPPVEYVPEEDYARELEGVKPIALQRAGNDVELREVKSYFHLSETSARKLLGEETMNEPSELTGTTVAELSSALNSVEDSIEFGERARLQLVTDTLPTREELNQFYEGLVIAGFHTSRPRARVAGLPVTELVITKGSPQWSALIGVIPVVMIVGIIAFGIMKIEAISKALVPLLLIGGGTAALIVAAISASPTSRGIAERAISRR